MASPRGLAARDHGVARLCAEILPQGYEVVLSNTATATVDLATDHEGTDPDKSHPARWVYGSIVPDALAGRSSKIQVHESFDPDEAPGWFDHAFPRHLRDTVVPGHSCFSPTSLSAAAHALLDEYRRVRLKDPSARSGQGQTVVGSPDEVGPALTAIAAEVRAGHAAGLAGYLSAYGYVVEADLEDVDACSVTVTRTPDEVFSSLGHQLETQVPTDDGSFVAIYGGTSSVVVRGEPASLGALPPDGVRVDDPLATDELRLRPTTAVVEAAARHIEGMRRWEPEGIVKTRANVDVITGGLVGRDGARRAITASVEDSGRPGGASPAELLAIRALQADPDLSYAVRSTRHSVGPAARIYGEHAGRVPGSRVFWDGIDEGWGNRYVFIGAF